MCRKHLFTQNGRTIAALPPTGNALTQHTLRSVYQGAHGWGQVILPTRCLPSPGDWGCKNKDWEPS